MYIDDSSAVPPVSPAGRPDGRREHAAADAARRGKTVVEDAPRGRALVATGRRGGVHRDRLGAPAMATTVAAQLIAQNVAHKSDRRLARHFPELAHAAYRHHAGLVAEQARPRHRRSA